MDNTWEIISIINYYNEAVKDIEKYSDEHERLEELYAQAIRIQCGEVEYGYIMVLEDFIECVRHGFFNDYDGHGYFLDKEGKYTISLHCDVKFLEKYKGTYPYISWFNK